MTCNHIRRLAACFALGVVCSAFAGKTPMALSIAYSSQNKDDSQMPSSPNIVTGGRLAFFSGAHRGMYGLAIAVGGNEDKSAGGDIAGIQAAGLFNTAVGAEYGAWQLSGFVNMLSSDGNGMQVSALYNETKGVFNGYMLCGFINRSENLIGAQITGVGNVANGAYGAQIALVNVADTVVGAQLGGVNFATSLAGVQVGGVNVVKSTDSASGMRGIQIGAFNYATTCTGGMQLGAVNIIVDNQTPCLPIFNCYF